MISYSSPLIWKSGGKIKDSLAVLVDTYNYDDDDIDDEEENDNRDDEDDVIITSVRLIHFLLPFS